MIPAILPSTRLALQVAAAAVLSSAFVDVTRIDRPYWVLLTAIAVMVGSAGETLARSIDRTVSTLVGLAAGAALYWMASRIGLPPVVLLAASAAASLFFLLVDYRLFILALTTALAVMFSLSGGGEAVLLARLYDTAIGAAIGAAVSFLVLPVPTRQPVVDAVKTYFEALEAMTHGALDAIARGEWSDRVEDATERLRASESTFEGLAQALRMESAILGARGNLARRSLAVLPVVRGLVESVVEAAEAAAATGLGPEIADDLSKIDRQVAANLAAAAGALLEGTSREVPPLAPLFRRIEDTLGPRLREGDEARTRVVAMINALLALRRLNRSLKQLAGGTVTAPN